MPEQELKQASTSLGKVEIYDEVIKTIAGLAASKVKGVFSLKGGFIEGIKQATTGRRDYSAGVEVKREPNGNFSLDLHIIIHYGFKIADVAPAMQEAVRDKVESITGRKVTSVNVHIADIRLPDEISDDESE
jgi:uncharacterized alkaline shock family protein YloU